MFALTSRSLAASRAAFASTAAMLMPAKGKVVSWIAGRGFGFIEDDSDKKQHFVHFSALQIEPGGYKGLAVGQEVEFEVTSQDGRTKADQVTGPNGAPLPSGPRPPPGDNNFRGGGSRGRGSFGGGGGGNYRGGRGRGGFRDNGDGGYGGRGGGGQRGNDDF